MDLPQLDRPAPRDHAASTHVLAEGGQRELLSDLGLADERPAAVPPHQVAVSHEVVERCAQRQARDAQVAAQPPLGRDRLADLELFDQLQYALPGQDLFAHSLLWKHRNGSMVKTTRSQPAGNPRS